MTPDENAVQVERTTEKLAAREMVGPVPESQETPDSADARQQQVLYTQETFSAHIGPLPNPETFRQYNEICPGAADRLLALVENEQQQRFENQRSFWDDAKRRRNYTLVLGLSVCLGAIIAIALGHPFEGAGIMAISLVGSYINKDPIKQETALPDS